LKTDRASLLSSASRAVRAMPFGLLAIAAAGSAAELPSFRPGIWEFERLVGNSKLVARECIDPTQEMRSNQASLVKLGCTLSPLNQDGSTYTFTSQCTMKLPSGASAWSTMSSLTVESDTAYRLQVRETTQGKTNEQIVVAHRVDDCK
jgi:hypothetical protein